MASHSRADSAPRRGRSRGRPPKGRARLTRERILTAALDLVAHEGLDSLSMRRLAAELGVNPMSIYHHVESKRALLDALVERAFGQFRMPPAPTAEWEEQVRAWAEGYRALTLRYQRLVLHLVSDPRAASRAASMVAEPLYAALRDAGLKPEGVLRAADTLVDLVHGIALAESARPRLDPLDRRAILGQAVVPAEAPTLHEVVGALSPEQAVHDWDAAFAAALDLLLAGVRATAEGAAS